MRQEELGFKTCRGKLTGFSLKKKECRLLGESLPNLVGRSPEFRKLKAVLITPLRVYVKVDNSNFLLGRVVCGILFFFPPLVFFFLIPK